MCSFRTSCAFLYCNLYISTLGTVRTTRMATLLSLMTIVVASVSYVSCHEIGGLTFEVPDNDRFCFYEFFHNASIYILEYKVRPYNYESVLLPIPITRIRRTMILHLY